eukprot:3584513-Rhodomonas_salina.2
MAVAVLLFLAVSRCDRVRRLAGVSTSERILGPTPSQNSTFRMLERRCSQGESAPEDSPQSVSFLGGSPGTNPSNLRVHLYAYLFRYPSRCLPMNASRYRDVLGAYPLRLSA